MADDNYTSVRLPNALIKEIDEVVLRKSKGFRSRADLIIYATRKELENVQLKGVKE